MTDDRAKRVCVYARVSTTRQAKHDLSIPDQVERAETWCAQNNAQIV